MGDTSQKLARWRLVLGRYADKHLPPPPDKSGRRMDRALDFLYGREYAGRGVRGSDGDKGPGSLDASQLTVPDWLNEVRELFPRETIETIEAHALDRYGMNELVTDPEALARIEPSPALLKMILSFKGHMKGEVLAAARALVRKIVEELRRKLEEEVRRSFSGHLNRFRHSPLQVARNFDWKTTIRRNLKNWSPERRQLVLQQSYFFSRIRRQLPWRIILCVDQSGSMVDSVIHTAVLAGILAGLPAVNVKLVVFDTAVVDLSDRLDDPVEVLMSIQLGGGTDIGGALTYAERLVEVPQRTVFALISDF
uniref:VWA domain-containing protein n=1 Tax=Luteolibacter marinus TaxID=2776705 RepID=UPI0018688712